MNMEELIKGLPEKGSNESGEYPKTKVNFSATVGVRKGEQIKQLKKAAKSAKKSLMSEIGGRRYIGDVTALTILEPGVTEHIEKISQEISAIENLCQQEEE